VENKPQAITIIKGILQRVAPDDGVISSSVLQYHFAWKCLGCSWQKCSGRVCLWCVLHGSLCWSWFGIRLTVSWAGRFLLVMERVINVSGKVHINDTLVWGYEGEVCMFHAHTWELMRERMFVGGWITHVVLRAGRSVELDYEWGIHRVGSQASRFVKDWNS